MRFRSPSDDVDADEGEDIWFVLLDRVSHDVPPALAAAPARLDSKRPPTPPTPPPAPARESTSCGDEGLG